MKAEITEEGVLFIIAKNATDHYVLKKWAKAFRKVNKKILKNGTLKGIELDVEAYYHR